MAKPGGIVDVPFENKVEFDDLARFAIEDYNQKHAGSGSILEFKKVLNVKQQIVAGIMYYITFEASEGGNNKEYEAKIWVKKWENFKKVVGFKLVGDESAKPGGIIIVPSPNNSEFQELARFAVQDYNNKQNAHLEFVENLNVKEQVVAGMMYYITLVVTDGGKKKIYEAKIWVKEWENFKKVVEFKPVDEDNGIPGGITNVPFPNSPEFQELAKFAIQDYNKKQNAHLEFVENLNVKEQVVAGTMYYITLAAMDGGKKNIYEAQIWVKEWEDFKKVMDFKLVGDDSKKLGGITDVPFPNKPKFQDLARFAVQDYNVKQNAHLEFVENLNVKEQPVSGMMYYITLVATDAGNKKTYETKIWVKEWEDFKKVIDFKLVGDDKTKLESNKLESKKLGGITNVPFPNKPEFQCLARFAVQDYNKKLNAHLEFVENLNVKEQVVAGMMYYITLVVTDGGQKKIYEAKIWVKEWEDFKKVVEFKLVGDDGPNVGGIITVPFPNRPEFQDLARFAVQDYNEKQNAHLEFVENLNVKEQVVAGIMYYVTLVATDGGKKNTYETKIWVKEWLNFKKVIEFKLVGDDNPILGGITNVPFPNSPEFQDLAKFAIQDYNKKQNAHLEFVENLNVKEQLVAGMTYYITLVATDAGKKKIYETQIWVKEWEDFKKVVEFKLVGDDGVPGGIIDVPWPNRPEFQELARFAVEDYNKKQNAHLEFVEVLNVKEQVVAGMMYYITLVVTDAGKKKIYEAKIWVKEWEKFKEVQEFTLVGDATK